MSTRSKKASIDRVLKARYRASFFVIMKRRGNYPGGFERASASPFHDAPISEADLSRRKLRLYIKDV